MSLLAISNVQRLLGINEANNFIPVIMYVDWLPKYILPSSLVLHSGVGLFLHSNQKEAYGQVPDNRIVRVV